MADIVRSAHAASTPVGIMWGYEAAITAADDAFLAIIGYSRDDLEQGRIDWRSMTPPEFLPLDEAGMRQAASSGGFTMPYQKEFFRKDGSRVPVLLVCAFVPGRVGEWMGYVVELSPERFTAAPEPAPLSASTPIPEELYRRLVGELVNERTRQRAMLDTSESPIWSVDAEWRMLSCNQAFQTLQRSVSGRIMQVGDSLMGPEFPEHDRQLWKGWYSRAFSGETFRTSTELTAGDRTYHHEHSFAPMRDSAGTIYGVTIVAYDVTSRVEMERALRSSELQFRTLAAGSPLGVFLVDAGGRFQYVNDRLAAIWQMPPEAMLGDGWRARVHPDDASRLAIMSEPGRTSMAELEGEYRLQLPDGEERLVRLLVKVRQQFDQPSGFVGTAEDITERQAVMQLREQRERLESLGTLAGGIAHDFNNMLSVIIGQAELALLMADDPVQQREALGEIRTASLRTRELVKQILAFSRQGESARAPVELSALANETMRLVRASLPASLDLAVRIGPAPMRVMGHAASLQQVLVNLCVNAEHATRDCPAPKVEVTLDVPANQLPPTARLRVRDNGSGMSPAVAAHIFEPFFTTKEIGDGTGLGLAMVHGTVLSHGGDVSVESEPGRGTTFTVTLPLMTD